MIQMIYNDTSDRSGCHRKRAASEILMMTSSVMPCGVCSVATKKKRVKILDFKLFHKHFVFVDKGNFDIKKILKRHIDVNVFVDIVCVSEK